MIKLKKLLAGVIGAAMMLTSATALASEVQTPDVTIDTTKTGSLTIHKYEYNGTEVIRGTGEEGNEVPDGAKALAGAGFTIYKVADVDALTDYYSTNPTDLPNVNTYVENGAIKSEYANTKARDEKITEAEGVVEFTGLDLGFYVVIETTTPDAVTSPIAPFIVSIPMTTVDGAEWLYDVHVYPKNGTKYGEVKLEKSGEDGALAGVIFALQKKNADGSWTDITNEGGAAGDNTGDALTLTTNANGVISVSGLTQGTYRFIETSVGDDNKGYIMDGKTAYEFTVNSDATVTYDGSTSASVTIPVKNEKPDLEKWVEDRKEGTWEHDSDYNVGDTIKYKVTVDVPANITDLEYFVVTDTPTHLVDDVNSVELMCDGAEVATNAYTVEENGDGFKITFTPANMAAYADKEIVITYNAVLQTSAAITVAGNPNTAKLEYSNAIYPDKATDPDNPNLPENPDDPTPTPGKDVIEDNAIVYTFKLNISKTGVDGNTETSLSGVVFDLYKEVTTGTTGAITGDDAKAVGLDSTKSWLKIDTLTTGTDGTVEYSGLANGTYYLVETKTNDGYNLLKAPVEVVLNIDYVTSMTTTWEWTTNTDGVKTLVKHEIKTSETTFTDKETETSFDGTLTQNIINKKGFELPTTGGMGSIIFIVGGIALAMAGLMIILASNKRARA